MALINKEQLLIQDEIVSQNPVEVIWNCHTFAEVSITGNKAILTLNGKQMMAEIVSPANAIFQRVTATPPPPLKSNEGITNLIVKLPLSIQNSKLIIRFYSKSTTPKSIQIKDLSEWK
jgi:hypothetical protein